MGLNTNGTLHRFARRQNCAHEALEQRQHLSGGTATMTEVNGRTVLTVIGTDLADSVLVNKHPLGSQPALTVTINETSWDFIDGALDVNIDLGRGDDSLFFGGNQVYDGEVYLGAGNDTVDASPDSLLAYIPNFFGEDGDDRITIYADGENGLIQRLSGGDGNDTIVYHLEEDNEIGIELDVENVEVHGSDFAVYSHDGDNRITAYVTGRPSRVYGAGGNDTLIAASGNARLFGESGNDSIVGGSGNDELFGGSGDDRIEARDGYDTVVSGVGDDDVLIASNSTALFTETESLTTLRIEDNGRGFLAAGVAAITTKNLELSPLAQLDLADNALILDYTGPTPIKTIRAALQSGHAGGAWDGPGIASSTAAADARFGVGFAESSDLFSSFPALFAGQEADDSALLLRYTRNGDADLSGMVDMADFSRLAAQFNVTTNRWSAGDFNYDGVTGFADFAQLASGFGQTVLRGIQLSNLGATEHPRRASRISSFERDMWRPIDNEETPSAGIEIINLNAGGR